MNSQPNGAKSEDGDQAPEPAREVSLPPRITVRDLADALDIPVVETIRSLMKQGIMAAVNQSVDYEAAAALADEMGLQPQPARGSATAVKKAEVMEDEALVKPRPPIVTVLGHVDHGKTSLLDAIRDTKVTEQEAGAITQHIGAYQVDVNGQKITFIDTPGHEAFTAMRARGARVTDIAVLVVAADDGVMPQTREAIGHARAADVPMVVAINKIDVPGANLDRLKQQLAEQEVLIEDYGGDVIAVPVSAKTREGLDDLLEHILLVAEMSELKANPDRSAEGTVIEAQKDPSRGPIATVLVQKGTLRIGDVLVTGNTSGKVRAMFDEHGQRMTEAPPSTPAVVMGLTAVAVTGDTVSVVEDERSARAMAEERERSAGDHTERVTMESVSGEIASGLVKELSVVVKADVQGSLEAIRGSLARLGEETVRLSVIHSGVGNVTESDVMLAVASKAIIIAFNVRPEPGARRLAASVGVDIRSYQIIYELIDDVEKAVKGLMEPVFEEIIDGHAEVRAIFKVRSGKIAGCGIKDGIVQRSSRVRLMRDGEVIHTSRVASLRRFEKDVREVTAGLECGIGVEKFDSFKEGDTIEAFHEEEKS
jgi:translation initiation factor IF-2